VKKVSFSLVKQAKQLEYAIAREDLTDLIENLRKLPKDLEIFGLILDPFKRELRPMRMLMKMVG